MQPLYLVHLLSGWLGGGAGSPVPFCPNQKNLNWGGTIFLPNSDFPSFSFLLLHEKTPIPKKNAYQSQGFFYLLKSYPKEKMITTFLAICFFLGEMLGFWRNHCVWPLGHFWCASSSPQLYDFSALLNFSVGGEWVWWFLKEICVFCWAPEDRFYQKTKPFHRNLKILCQ